MTQPRGRSPWLRAAAFGALAAALVVAACETPGPVQSRSPSPAPRAPATPREAVARYFPEVLTRGMGGETQVVFVASAEGEVVGRMLARRLPGTGLIETVPDAQGKTWNLANAGYRPQDIESAESSRFRPGEMGPDPVSVVWMRLRAGVAPLTGAQVRQKAREGEEVVTYREPGPGERVEMRSAAAPAGKPPVPLETVRGAVRRYAPSRVTGPASKEPVWFVVSASGEVIRYGDGTGSAALNQYRPEEIDQVDVFNDGRISFDGVKVPVIWVRLKA